MPRKVVSGLKRRKHGMKLPQWWLGSSEPAALHLHQNELQANVFPHESAGEWISIGHRAD
jgi:hypothetical protein